jgi:hypothetical protein
VSFDLVFGKLRRNWSLGSVPVAKSEAPTRDQVLEQEIKAGPPTGHKKASPKEMVMSKLREASPEAMELYEKYRPTYKDHQVVLRAKI